MAIVKAFVVVCCLVLFAGACGDAGPTTTSTEPATAAIYAAAAYHLATESNTFGPGHRFAELLVVDATMDNVVESYGTGVTGPEYTEDERSAIEAALSQLSPVRFIEDAADWRTEEDQPAIPGSAIITLGPAQFQEDASAHVGVSLWCNMLCGFWTTFVLETVDGVWQVTGTHGPSIIS